MEPFWLLRVTSWDLVNVIFVFYVLQRLTINSSFPWQWCKYNDNYCTILDVFLKLWKVNTKAKCSNFGTIGKFTIWRTQIWLETGYSIFHDLSALLVAVDCTLYLCTVSTRALVQPLLQRNFQKFLTQTSFPQNGTKLYGSPLISCSLCTNLIMNIGK